MKAIRYDLRLRTPVLATDILGEPNSAVSLPYLTGSLLRGALISQYLQRRNLTELEASDPFARNLFLSHTTRYLHAYPLSATGQRAIPIMKSWRFDKTELPEGSERKRKIYCLEVELRSNLHEEKIGAHFGWLNNDTLYRCQSVRQLNVHTRRDALLGRPTQGKGDIYRYDALAVGTEYQAVIWTADDLVDHVVSLLTGATLWVGRARRAGYGETEVIRVHEPIDEWRELDPDKSPEAVPRNGALQVTLFSPALVRDLAGQASLDPATAIEELLGLPHSTLCLQPVCAFADAMLIGGFNRKWKSPLPQQVAVVAGSTFRYVSQLPIASSDLVQLERRGIGERSNEGYGQVIFNWRPNERGILYSQNAPSVKPPNPIVLDVKERLLVDRISKAVLRRELEARLQERINITSINTAMSNNQLMRLRVVIRYLRRTLSINADLPLLSGLLDQYLKQFEKRSVGLALKETRVREGNAYSPIDKWMLGQLENPESVWGGYRLVLGDDMLIATDRLMAVAYSLRLIDRVLHRTQKERDAN